MRRFWIGMITLIVLLSGCDAQQFLATPKPSGSNNSNQPQADVNHMALGNPSGALPDTSSSDNYLIQRPEYSLAYNRKLNILNWVSWHLDIGDLGSTDRSQFTTDPDLPEGWYRVKPTDYTNSGYDRGHMLPSADRTASESINRSVFYMTNIVPQAPDNNQGPWKEFEDYCRDLVRDGKQLYLIAGPEGSDGSIGDPKIRVPKYVWKIALVLDANDQISDINRNTEVIALRMPNRDGIRDKDWRDYIVSVATIEEKTKYTFFTNLSSELQTSLKQKVATP